MIPQYNVIYMGCKIGLQQPISIGGLQVCSTDLFFVIDVKRISYFHKVFHWTATGPYTIKGSVHGLLEQFLFVCSLTGLLKDTEWSRAMPSCKVEKCAMAALNVASQQSVPLLRSSL